MGESKVVVYGFHVFEGSFERTRLVGFKATREAIESSFGGEVIEGTAESVEAAEVDPEGCFHRRPTGWGALGPA